MSNLTPTYYDTAHHLFTGSVGKEEWVISWQDTHLLDGLQDDGCSADREGAPGYSMGAGGVVDQPQRAVEVVGPLDD